MESILFLIKYEIEKTDQETRMYGFSTGLFSRWLVFLHSRLEVARVLCIPGCPCWKWGGSRRGGALCSFDLIPLSLAPYLLAAFTLPFVLEAKVSGSVFSEGESLVVWGGCYAALFWEQRSGVLIAPFINLQ